MIVFVGTSFSCSDLDSSGSSDDRDGRDVFIEAHLLKKVNAF